MADQRQKIITSVFSRRNASGNLEETYVSHVKIWEDAGPEGGGRKPRYILLSQANNGSGFIHKSKLNTNGSFSVGKTWRLAELRTLQVVNPLAFNITLSRTYRWQTENQIDQANFLDALIRLFRTVTRGSVPLQLEGIQEPDPSADTPSQTNYAQPSPSSSGITSVSQNQRSRTSSQSERPSDPSDRVSSPLAPRNGVPPRAASPAMSGRSVAATRGAMSKARPPSITVPQQGTSPLRQPRRPSNAGSTSSQVTSVNLQTMPSQGSSLELPRDARQTSNNLLSKDTSQKTRTLSPVPSRAESPGLSTRTRKISSQSAIAPTISDGPSMRRDQHARISYFDPSNQAMLDRLITGPIPDDQLDVEGEEADAQATLANVEEMIEGYEWASDDVIGRKGTRGAVELIEARLLDELMALEKANIHSFLESDDRIAFVMKFMDEAIAELDNMDGLISSYKIHLNAANEDILYIQSQNRGLQVQTQNQRALLAELQNLLRTVHVDQDALVILTQESLEKAQSIQHLEESASELYKALLAGRDTDMAATMERLQEYRTHNSQFCKRVFDFLSIMFTAQAKLLLGETDGILKPTKGRPSVIQHREIEAYLGRYAGLMLYLKEMDENIYARLCAAYFSAASDLHGTQIKALLGIYINFVRKMPEEEQEQGFSATTLTAATKGVAGIRRAGTIIRSPVEARNKEKDKPSDADLRASEVFGKILEQIAPLVYRESEFIADFLQINDAALTFADYMGLDSYFRRQAARAAGLSQTTLKLVRGAMDLIFGFLSGDLKIWLDKALARDYMEIIGVLSVLERFQVEAEERNHEFFQALLSKQHTRLKAVFDRHVNDQLKGIEQTKLNSKKRKGIAHFVKYFPVYVTHVENQLFGADGLEIRISVDEAYDKIVKTMFDSLKQMAKLEGEGEDKGQLNFHVILIENMHYFIGEMSRMDLGSVSSFIRQAEGIYDENLSAYVKLMFRRPFGKIIDYFEGVDNLLKTTGPGEIAANAAYNKSALKKVLKEYSVKDIRKHVEALSKRVEKHFVETAEKTDDVTSTSAAAVSVGVWKACEEELVKLTGLFLSLISQCYTDTGVSLEYTVSDVESAFRRLRVGI